MKITIKGNGTSLWGKSNGTYIITEIEFLDTHYENGEGRCFGQLDLSGKGTRWYQYTDQAIVKAMKLKKVLNPVKKIIEKEVGHEIKDIQISWSEQGMQPAKGWNFDVLWERV